MKNPRGTGDLSSVKLLLLKAKIRQEIRELATLLGSILGGVVMTAGVFLNFSFIGFKVLFTHKCTPLRKPVGNFVLMRESTKIGYAL